MLDEAEPRSEEAKRETHSFQEEQEEPLQKKVLNKVSSFFQETFSK